MSLLSDLVNLYLSDTIEKVIAEYIWIGGSGIDLRSKARTLPAPVSDPQNLPKWNYDGLSTGQALGKDSEVVLYPQAIFKDPFRRGNSILGVANRGNSVKVGRDTAKEGKWYFKDKRPASNMDPYVVTSMIVETTIFWKP